MTTNRLPYETSAGNLSASDTYAQLLENLRLAEEDCRLLGNMRKSAGDNPNYRRWRQIADNFLKVQKVISVLAEGKTKTSVGFTNG
jgi:hypothetical protein